MLKHTELVVLKHDELVPLKRNELRILKDTNSWRTRSHTVSSCNSVGVSVPGVCPRHLGQAELENIFELRTGKD